MFKDYLKLFLLVSLAISSLSAKTLIDCRVATAGMTECNPYGKRLHHVKKVKYDYDRQKLIIEKTLPTPEKKHFFKVISVADMIEKYIKVEDSVRFKGSDSKPSKVKVTQKVPDIIPIKEEKQNDISLPKEIKQQITPKPVEKEKPTYGIYTVVKGDVLSKIAKKFGFKSKKLVEINTLKNKSSLHIGQKLKIPLDQEMVDAITNAAYTVKNGDTLIGIAKKFDLSPKDLVRFNHIKDATKVRKGKILKLPLPYVLKRIALEKKKAKARASSRLDVNGFGKRKLRVTATAYTSHRRQTDKTPFLAAWNNRLRPGVKSIAVSRDLLTRYGMRNGTKVRIGGLRGYYRVRDKMNKRYRKRIDIYMGLDRRRALRWGRRSVVIYW